MSHNPEQSRFSGPVAVAVLASVAAAVMFPTLIFGLPMGHDLPHHYQCAMTFAEAIRAGDLYPSWSLNRNFGFGGMETRLYPPVSHYLLAVAHLATGEWHLSSWFVFVFLSFAGSFGVYLWTQEYFPAAPALIAGILYAFVPYHLNQLYNTFFFAEYAGSAVLPFVFLSVSRVCRRGTLRDTALLAVAFALLILTHLPLTVIGSAGFALYALTLIDRRRSAKQLAGLAAGALWGIAAGSFFWIKVISERDLMAKATVYADPWLDYRLNFLLTFLQSYEGFAVEVYENGTSFYELTLYYLVAMVLFATLPFVFGAVRKRSSPRGVWAVFVLALFLTFPFSRPVWDALPPLQETQFPWRWLAIASVCGPVLAVSKFEAMRDSFVGKYRPLVFVAVGAALAMVTFSISQIIRPAPYVARDRIAAFMDGNSQDAGLRFWWPIWAREEAFANQERITVEGRSATDTRWEAETRVVKLGPGGAASPRLGIFYHPNWKVTTDGRQITAAPDEFGALTFDVPPGEQTVSVEFAEPAPVRIGGWVSSVTWAMIGAAIVISLSRRRKEAQ